MIESKTQYRIVCDADGCGAATGLHHDREAVCRQAHERGWEDGVGPALLRLWRCPKCVAAGKFPDGWRNPLATGDETG